jgi:hypothetical protein
VTDTRKTLGQLKAEYDKFRPMFGKTFRHIGNGDKYILLFVTFDEQTNETKATYGSAALPWLKFDRPMSLFLERFEQDH